MKLSAGTKSSEFFISLAVVVAATILRALGDISDEVWGLACGIQGGVYTAARSLVKKDAPVVISEDTEPLDEAE